MHITLPPFWPNYNKPKHIVVQITQTDFLRQLQDRNTNVDYLEYNNTVNNY